MPRTCHRLVTYAFDFLRQIASYIWLTTLSTGIAQKRPSPFAIAVSTERGQYTSMAYNEIIRDTNIVRSMSRAGKPTDNPVNEALNGWIKEELMIDFKLNGCTTREQVKGILEDYKVNWLVRVDSCIVSLKL